MKPFLLIAGTLCFILGLAHSILGEILIFQNNRTKGSIVPSKKQTNLKEKHLRIIWATWHLASLFGWCIGIITITIALQPDYANLELSEIIIESISYTIFLGAALVLFGTKGKHPGWVVLILIGVFLLLGK